MPRAPRDLRCDHFAASHAFQQHFLLLGLLAGELQRASDGHVFGIPTGEVSRMDGSGGTVIAAVLYCTGHGLSAPAVGCLLLSSDAIALFDAAASGHSCCCENRTSNDLLLGANIILSIQFVPPHLPLQSPPSRYPPSTFAPARGRSGRYFFVYFGFVDWIPARSVVCLHWIPIPPVSVQGGASKQIGGSSSNGGGRQQRPKPREGEPAAAEEEHRCRGPALPIIRTSSRRPSASCPEQ